MKKYLVFVVSLYLLIEGIAVFGVNGYPSETNENALCNQSNDELCDIPSGGPYDIMTEDLAINGDDDLENLSSSGGGTINDPYIIRGLNISTYRVRVENTTSYFKLTDLLWGESSEYRMIFKNNDHILIEDLSMDSDYFIWGDDCRELRIINSTFSAGSPSKDPIYFDDLSNLFIEGSDFSTTGSMVRNRGLRFLGNEGQTHISNSTFTWIGLFPQIHGRQIIEWSSFKKVGYLDPRGMSNNSEIRHNDFNLNMQGGIAVINLVRGSFYGNQGRFHNNTIETNGLTTGMMISGSCSTRKFTIENNLFKGQRRAIIITSISDPYCDIFSNRFENCIDEAIQLTGGGVNIWKNLFINNSLQSGGKQVNCDWTSSKKIKFDIGGVGNYWNDHTIPDTDGDGIVDIPYNLTSTYRDSFPITNPNLDIEKPNVSFTNHSSGLIHHSYNRIGWDAEDEYGIRKVELQDRSSYWTDVTEKDAISVFLEEGSHEFSLKATDKNGLFAQVNLTLEINQTVPVMEFNELFEGCFVEEDPINATWEIVDYFTVYQQNLTLDGEWEIIDNDARYRILDLDEGPHSISICLKDDLGTRITKEVHFTVDRNAPKIELIAPVPGSVLSNPSFNFKYNVLENVGIDRIRYRFDQNEWDLTEKDVSTSRILITGEHVLEVQALDNAGHMTEMALPFEISEENLIDIESPVNGTVFHTSYLDLNWSYDGVFEWTSAWLRVGMNNDFVPLEIGHDHVIDFPRDGTYKITLKLMDDLGNFVRSDVSVLRDSKRPTVGFTSIEDGQYVSTRDIDLRWNAIDDRGIAKYLLRVDDGPWTDMGTNTSVILELGEGEHVAKIMAFDQAENSHESRIGFIVDTREPYLAFLDPDPALFTSPQIPIGWNYADTSGIAGMDLIIGGVDTRNVLGKNGLTIVLTRDGQYTLVLNATDPAGNNASISKTISVDLTKPRITWVGDPISVSGHGNLDIEWEIEELMGLESIAIEINGETTNLNVTDRKYRLDLQEGEYTIIIKVVDTAGWETRLRYPNVMLIDTSEPTPGIDSTSTVRKGVATLRWASSDEMSDVHKTMVSLDGGDFFEVEGEFYSVEGLEPGEHTMILRVTDSAGNSAEETWTFTIERKNEDQEDNDSGIPILPIIIVILVIAVIGVGVGLIVYRKVKAKKENDEEKTEKEDKEKPERPGPVTPPFPQASGLSPPPKTNRQPLAGDTRSTLPPAQSYQRPPGSAQNGQPSGKEESVDGGPDII